jgi:hypothetical protein
MRNFVDSIRIEGGAFCLEIGNFVMAEEMIAKLGCAASASLAGTALRQRIRDFQITFWETRYGFASTLKARFPNYKAGHLYEDLCRSRKQRCAT